MSAVYRGLADGVVVLHFLFVIYVAVGGFLVWRWPRAVYPHLAALAWSVGIVTFHYDCPLTPLEKYLRERGGGQAYAGGFIDHYIEGVIYPARYTTLLRVLLVVLVLASYTLLAVKRRERRPTLRLPR